MEGGEKTWRQLLTILASAAIVALPVGCGGSDRAHVTGRITRADGTPFTAGRIMARSNQTGKWASGVTGADGEFALGTAEVGDGIPPGDYYVTIREVMPETDRPPPPTIPAKYADPSASGLELHLKPGETKIFDVKLDSL